MRVVLVHSGITDASMWDGFELPGQLLRHRLSDDLEGTVGGEPAVLLGASYGGLVCLDFAARHPELVEALVLLDAPLPDHDWSAEVIAYDEAEQQLLEAGDVPGAVELNVFFWAPALADRLRPMTEVALRMEIVEIESVDLGAVRAPTLVVVGEHDHQDFHEIADRLMRELEDADRAIVPGAHHLPAMERPEATAELVGRFLAERV